MKLRSEVLKCSIIAFLTLFSARVWSEAIFYQKKAEGWFWYEEHPKDKEPLESLKTLTPSQTITVQRETLEKQLHKAILEPSFENIKQYLYLQKGIMDQSQRFSENWQKVLLLEPALDETITHPVNQTARHIYLDAEKTRKEAKIKSFSEEYGLFFFFNSQCKFCEAFAPTVKIFADKYQWEVLPISLDGGTLAAFPNPKTDNGLAARLKITTVPSLIAMHVKTKAIIPLSFKLISETELEQLIDLMTRTDLR